MGGSNVCSRRTSVADRPFSCRSAQTVATLLMPPKTGCCQEPPSMVLARPYWPQVTQHSRASFFHTQLFYIHLFRARSLIFVLLPQALSFTYNSFTRATLSHATLSHTTLSHTQLCHMPVPRTTCHLSRATFSRATLSHTTLLHSFTYNIITLNFLTHTTLSHTTVSQTTF